MCILKYKLKLIFEIEPQMAVMVPSTEHEKPSLEPNMDLFVCLSVGRINKKVVNGFKEISWRDRAWPRNRVIKF